MGCSSSTPRDCGRDDGFCVIEVVRCEHLPNMDVGSLTDAFVKCRFVDTIDVKIKDSVKLKTSVQWNSLNPVFHSYLAFPFFPHEADTVEFKIVDIDLTNANDDIGRAEVKFTYLLSRIGDEVTLDIRLQKNVKSAHGKTPTITIRLVKLSRNKPKKTKKEFFVIRHGESIWNESQDEKNVKGMIGQYDHELTMRGIGQAQSLQKKWMEIKEDHSKDKHGDLKSFLSASAIFSSPLTRAAQTALLACKDHPTLQTGPLVLLRNLREVKNFGSFDTVGQYVGSDIEHNVKKKLNRDLGQRETQALLGVEIDPYDAMDSWWTPLQQKEKKEHINQRFTDLWAFLRYGTDAETAILVGHSHFFRHMCKDGMSAKFRQKEPVWTSQLDKEKLDNGGCLRVTVEWDGSQDPMQHPVITSARLVFGSRLTGGASSSDGGTAGGEDPRDDARGRLSSFSRPSIMDIQDNEEKGESLGASMNKSGSSEGGGSGKIAKQSMKTSTGSGELAEEDPTTKVMLSF